MRNIALILYKSIVFFLILWQVWFLAADAKSESVPSESEGREEVTETKETEELVSETGSNGNSESKQENVEDGNDNQNSQSVFTYEQLKAKSGSDLSGVDLKRREVSPCFACNWAI